MQNINVPYNKQVVVDTKKTLITLSHIMEVVNKRAAYIDINYNNHVD
jgi:hypothetical protein